MNGSRALLKVSPVRLSSASRFVLVAATINSINFNVDGVLCDNRNGK